MTYDELHEAHRKLGLSVSRVARVCGVSDGRTVRRWWSGERSIPGPVLVLTQLLLDSAEARGLLGVSLKSD